MIENGKVGILTVTHLRHRSIGEMSKKVLVVDDSEVNQQVLRWMLRDLGEECDVVSSGEDAVKAVQNESYKIVFMDLRMPDTDGFQATTKLRSAGFKAPIIAVTASSDEEDWKNCMNAGMNGYLTKPFLKGDFKDIFEHWTGQVMADSG